jgi:predicted RecB family nuclease
MRYESVATDWRKDAEQLNLNQGDARVYRNGAPMAGGSASVRISKSKFIAGCQCLKRLYWQVHQPELAAEPDNSAETMIEQGREVGMLARQLFPGGVEVGSMRLDQAIRATKELIANPDVPAIFEGVFEGDGLLVRVDVLQRRRENLWRLVEVKSASDLRDHHIEDVAIQSYVLPFSGVKLATVWLAHINRDYVLNGMTVDPRQFFLFRNLTTRAQNLQPELVLRLRSQFRILGLPNPPDVPAGPHCVDPIVCEFFAHCNQPKPDDYIGYLPRLHASAIEQLEEMGVESIHDIPADFELSEIQRRACTAVQTGQPWLSQELNVEFASLKYPLYYMDFETVNPAIPRFVGMHPYDHLPFQWSVHVQREPGAAPEHFEFLAMDGSDPRKGFMSSLSEALGESGSIIVYNEQFEFQRLRELSGWLPDYTQRVRDIQARLWDLLPVVRNHIYHPAFEGSYSLKAVLPAFVPEMTYEGMEVPNGQAAGLAWNAMIGEKSTDTERQTIRKALLDYCGQDTLALVRLLKVMQGRSDGLT